MTDEELKTLQLEAMTAMVRPELEKVIPASVKRHVDEAVAKALAKHDIEKQLREHLKSESLTNFARHRDRVRAIVDAYMTSTEVVEHVEHRLKQSVEEALADIRKRILGRVA